ncbi:MAG: tRNA lysidine(34) synthetase TilS [Phycisphaerae bacterium]|nr:tRNA lysidine(34) synthetase TilS [Phycisphaerae bacterium]
MNNNSTFLNSISDQINSHEMIADGENVLLAVSGGCDSISMTNALYMLGASGQLNIGQLFIAHLDHKLRDESIEDAQFVQAQANRLSLKCIIEEIDVNAYASENNESIETAARNCRYLFLADVANRYNCTKVAFAHNADDNTETVLHRIIRGTGVKGLVGIPPVRDFENQKQLKVIRPILHLTRSEIENFAAENNIEYRLDRSNLSTEYTRNRIRLELLPLLRKYNPKVSEAINRLSLIANRMQRKFDINLENQFADCLAEIDSNALSFDNVMIGQLDDNDLSELIRLALAKLGISQRHISFSHIDNVIKISRGRHSGDSIELPGHVNISLHNDLLSIRKATPELFRLPYRVTLPVPGATVIMDSFAVVNATGSYSQIATEFVDGGLDDVRTFQKNKTFESEMIDADKIEGQLYVCARKPGDKFKPLGSSGKKSVSDIFTDIKLSPIRRDQIAMVCDNKGILWLMGHRIADRVKATTKTKKLLKITAIR